MVPDLAGSIEIWAITAAGGWQGLPESVQNTLLTVVGTIIVAAITGGLAVHTRNRRRHGNADADEYENDPIVPDTPLSRFSGTQNEFTELVLRDNAEFRRRIEAVERTQREAETRHLKFRRAVVRYFATLAAAWPGPDPMPRPDDPEDIRILEDTLPRFWPRS